MERDFGGFPRKQNRRISEEKVTTPYRSVQVERLASNLHMLFKPAGPGHQSYSSD